MFSSSTMSFISVFMILWLLRSSSVYANGCYTSIISFGDSLTDTGNMKKIASISKNYITTLHSPYGETFFHHPTGRASDGRLIIDFLAESLGLPLIPPFLHDKDGENVTLALGQGVNYAVIGATTLDSSFFESRGIVNPLTNASLGVQLEWFKRSLSSICSNVSDCRNLMERSLILMGEMGGSDYNLLVFNDKPLDEIESSIPLVTDTIIAAVNELIDMGAQTIVVPGTFPLGCSSAYLTIRGSKIKEEYDNTTGCLIRFNKFVEYHNKLLQIKLNQLRQPHPDIFIIYADYYNAAMQIIRSPAKFGFLNKVLKSCCGGEGPYNYNVLAECGYPSAGVCDDPNVYVYWDGVHFTEAANKIIFTSLFQGPYTTPQFNTLCPTIKSQAGYAHTLDL